MKEFLQPQIDSAKEFFESQGYPVETSTLGDLTVSYYVLPQGLNPELPDFAFRMTVTDSQTHEVSGIFGVSDSVSEKLRPYWAAHEVIEFVEIGISEIGRCIEAEERVLGLVGQDLNEEYVDKRLAFFENLCKYFEGKLSDGSSDFQYGDLEETRKTFEYLKEVQRKINGETTFINPAVGE